MKIIGYCLIALGCFFFLDYFVEGQKFHGDRNCYVGFGLWIVGTLWLILGYLKLAFAERRRDPTLLKG